MKDVVPFENSPPRSVIYTPKMKYWSPRFGLESDSSPAFWDLDLTHPDLNMIFKVLLH